MKPSKELFDEIETHLLQDDVPSTYLNSLITDSAFQEYPFEMLAKLKTVQQSPKHHPEGDVWKHTMLVVDEAAKVKGYSKNPKCFMWAALLHDIGKHATTKVRKGRITAYDHDKVGAELANQFLNVFTNDTAFIQNVVELVRWHMHILYVVNELPFANIMEMKKHIDVTEVALLGSCDRLGRLYVNKEEVDQTIQQFLQKCNS